MRLEQLYIFQEIARTGSLRKAAEALYLSPQSVSKSMIALEEEWGVSLLDRSHTGAILSSTGEKTLPYVQKILDDIDTLQEQFPRSAASQTAKLTQPVLICCCSVMEVFISGTVNPVISRYPSTPVLIDKKSSMEIRQILGNPDVQAMPDIVLTNHVPAQMDTLRMLVEQNYSCYVLFEDELRLQVPKSDPLAELEYIPLKTLTKLPMLLYTGIPTQRTESEQILSSWGYDLKNVNRISNIETCSQIALNQKRYCFVGFPSVEFRPMPNVTYVPLERKISTYQLLLKKKHPSNPIVTKSLVAAVDECFEMKKQW